MPGGINTTGGGTGDRWTSSGGERKKKGGPFIDWSSPMSIITAGPRAVSGAQRQFGEMVVGATLGAPALAGSVGSQIAHTPWNYAYAFNSLKEGDIADFLNESNTLPWRALTGDEEYKRNNPFFAPMGESIERTAQDVQHVARAGGNAVVPSWAPFTEGQPFGESVGELGSGPGLLGKTEYAQAAERGGGGVVPKLIEDAANISLVTGPVAKLAGAGAKAAGAESTARLGAVKELGKVQAQELKSVQAAVKTAAKEADDAAARLEQVGQRVPTTGYDPYFVAEHAQVSQEVRAARETLRQAKEFEQSMLAQHADELAPLQAEADTAAQHAAKLQRVADTAELVKNMGIAAGNSPFAPLTGLHLGPGVHVPGIMGVAGRAVAKAAGTPTAQRYVGPLIARVEEMAQNAREKSTVDRILEGEVDQRLTEQAQVTRGQARIADPLHDVDAKGRPVRDVDAETVAILSQQELGVLMRQAESTVGVDGALQVFAEAYPRIAAAHPELPQVLSADALMLAREVWSGEPIVSERAQRIRDAIPEVRARYARETGGMLDENYRALRGDVEPIMVERKPITEGTLDQVQHNLEGTTTNIEHMPQTHRARERFGRAIERRERDLARAEKVLGRAIERAEKTGITDADRANPASLIARVREPAQAVAAYAVDTGIDLSTATEPGLLRIAQRVEQGRLGPVEAQRALADEIIMLAAPTRRVPLSPVAQELVGEFLDSLEGPMPRRRLPKLTSSLAPAERIGRGTERALIGTRAMESAERQLTSGYEAFSRAYERMAGPNRAPVASVRQAADRVTAAVTKLRDLTAKLDEAQRRVDETEGGDLFAQAGVDRREVIGSVKDVRRAVKAFYQETAAALVDEMRRMDILTVEWPRPTSMQRTWNRGYGGSQNVNKATPNSFYDALVGRAEAIAHDKRFFNTKENGGRTPENIVASRENFTGDLSGGRSVGGGGGDYAPDWSMSDWLDTVEQIRMYEDIGRRGIDTGWDPNKYALVRGDVLTELAELYGPDIARQIVDDVVYGHSATVADTIMPKIAEATRAERGPESRIVEGGDVYEALRRDQQLGEDRGTGRGTASRAQLDPAGKALYDQAMAEGIVAVQERIVAQRGRQLGEATENVATSARRQGQKEGKALGAAETRIGAAERDWNRGQRQQESGQAIIGESPQLAQEAASRVADPLMRMFGEDAVANQGVLDAAGEVVRAQRHIERLNEQLARREAQLHASIDAAPRPFRPVLEMADRMKRSALEEAARLDEEIGPYAGESYRLLAEDMTVTLDQLVKAGINPQYIIGTHEQPLLGLEAGGKQSSRAGRNLPSAKKTGHRTKGRGLAVDLDYESQGKRVKVRLRDIIRTETAQKIHDAFGGTLGAALEAIDPVRYAPDQVAQMAPEQLVAAMNEHKLSAWDPAQTGRYSDRYGRPRAGASVTAETGVIPRHIYRHYAAYTDQMAPGGVGGTALAAYDRLLRGWKTSVLALSGRWHVGNIAGNALMATVGGGIDPVTFVRNMARARRLLKIGEREGGMPTDADLAWLDKTFGPEMRAVLDEGMYAPAPVIGKGWTAGEGLLDQMSNTDTWWRNPIKKSYAFNGVVDDMTRVAVFLSKAEKGLTAKGWADFKNAYPELVESGANLNREQAIKLALRTVGDFTNLSAFEQAVIKRIVPFYPWLRHITKLTGNMAIHDPVRTAWTLHLANLMAPEPSEVRWLRGVLEVSENRFLRTVAWNPFETVANISDPNNTFSSVSPFISTAAAGTLGVDTRGIRGITRPPNTVRSGDLKPLLGDPSALAYFAGGQVPQIAAARESIPQLWGSEPVRRYQTGEPIIAGGRFIPSNDLEVPGTRQPIPGALAPWMSLTGLPRQEFLNDEAIAKAEEERKRKEREARKTYEDQRRKARR